MRIGVLVATALAFGAMPAVAQEPAREKPEAFSFGSAAQEHVVQAAECHPNTGAHLVAHNYGFFGIATVGASITCPVDLPHGARVTAVECAMYDSFAAGDILVEFAEFRIDATTGAPTAESHHRPRHVRHPRVSDRDRDFSLAGDGPAAERELSQRLRPARELPADLRGNAAFRECVVL